MIAAALAIAPATWPPRPSATAYSQWPAYAASSLASRTRPLSEAAAHLVNSLVPGIAPLLTAIPVPLAHPARGLVRTRRVLGPGRSLPDRWESRTWLLLRACLSFPTGPR